MCFFITIWTGNIYNIYFYLIIFASQTFRDYSTLHADTIFNMSYRILFALTFLTFWFRASAAGTMTPLPTDKPLSLYFKNIDVEDGLSQCMVYAILQDKTGFIWLGTQNGLNRYDGISIKTYKRGLSAKGGIANNAIFSLAEDASGKIWIGTDTGVSVFDPVTEKFSVLNITVPGKGTVNGITRSIACDSIGNVWAAVSGHGIFHLDAEGNASLLSADPHGDGNSYLSSVCLDSYGNIFCVAGRQQVVKFNPRGQRKTIFDSKAHGLGGSEINCIYLDNDSTLLLGTVDQGVVAINPGTSARSDAGKWNSIPKDAFVRCIGKDKSGRHWIGSQQGLFVHSPATGAVSHFNHSFSNPYSLSDNAIHSMFRDSEGGMWIGTYFGGVNYCHESADQFEKFYPAPSTHRLSGKCISEFCEDSEGRIWIGTEDAGLNCLNPDGTFSNGFVPARNIHALLNDGSTLWVGSFADGLYTLDTRTGSAHRLKHSSGNDPKVDNNIYSIFKDSGGKIWIGTRKSLDYYDPTAGMISSFPSPINSQVNDMAEDSKGNLWLATIWQGLFRYSHDKKEWLNVHSVSHKDTVGGCKAICLYCDSNDNIWVGTKGAGLVMCDNTGRTLKEYSIADGLPDDVVYRIIPDSSSGIWGSTNNGMFRLDTESGKIRTYTYEDGLPGNQFNYKSGFADSQGNIYFGGVKGFVRFRPDRLICENVPPKIVFNSLKVDNSEIPVGDNPGILSESITHASQITLPYEKSAFSIGFGTLSFASPHRIDFKYKLEGWDKDWVEAHDSREAIYSNLPPGNYTFSVKISDSDGHWDDAISSVRIRIKPPFYLSAWAFLIYFIILASGIFLLWLFLRKRNRQRQAEAISRLQHSYEKELYDLKINFFTNITHEIRTPLSLIKIPIDEVVKNTAKNDPNYPNLSIVKRNTDRLLSLVNQLLDFRKSEVAEMKLNFVNSNISTIIDKVADRFRPAIDVKGLNIHITKPSDLDADIDIEAFTKIVSNLLSNALKHADSYISVNVKADKDRFKISVTNDGTPIPEEKTGVIFQPFVKLDSGPEGTGIGLSLVKRLVEAHGGHISLSQTPDSICFTADFPRRQSVVMETVSQTAPVASLPEIPDEITNATNPFTVLIVEDNPELLLLMERQLQTDFNVITASDGILAVEKLETNYIDLVISDVMMPNMNGMELCDFIKRKTELSHIPVILLTANSDSSRCLDGLKIGADDYIMKPYSIEFLKARILNLINSRRKLIEAFKNSPSIQVDSIADNESNSLFLKELVDKISHDISNPDISVDWLAERLNMSRATLYRKIKGVSDLTPNDFIRLVRLKQAATLLRGGSMRIAEVSEACGFSSPSYFTKCFIKQFGVSPSEYSS